jgi:predicted esterase
VLWAGPLPPELDAASVAPLRRVRLTRVLGERDEMAAAEHVEAEQERLRQLGLDAPLLRFDGGHELDRAALEGLTA